MKKLLTILIALSSLFLPFTANATTFDATVTTNGNPSANITTGAFTVASNATALVVGVGNVQSAVLTATCGGKALTKLGSSQQGTTRRAELWGVVRPPTGSITCNVTLAASESVVIGAVSVTQSRMATTTGASGAFGTYVGNQASSGSPTVTVTGNIGDLFVSTSGSGSIPTGVGASQVQRWLDASPSNISGVGSTAINQTSIAMTVTVPTTSWATGAVPIKNIPEPYAAMQMGSVF